MPDKTCSICKVVKPASPEFFTRDSTRKDGFRPQCKSCMKQIRTRDADKLRARDRANYRAKTEKYKNYSRDYRATHRESVAASQRRYKQQNVGIIKKSNHQYRARKRGAETAPFDEQAQLKRQRGKCYYCGCKLEKYHIEHVVPLSRGGSDRPENKVLSCPECNYRKKDKLPHEWIEGGRLL